MPLLSCFVADVIVVRLVDSQYLPPLKLPLEPLKCLLSNDSDNTFECTTLHALGMTSMGCKESHVHGWNAIHYSTGDGDTSALGQNVVGHRRSTLHA